MKLITASSLISLAAFLAVVGCTTTAPLTPPDAGVDAGPPPKVCRAPAATGDAWFTEVTADYGLAKTDTFEPLATGVAFADLDGDGYKDFYAAVFPAQREPAGTKRTRFLFMNRPNPDDASQRIYVDALDDSGLLATRDGEGGRGLTGISFADIDNDGDIDAIGCGGWIDLALKDGCAAFLNDGKAHFTLADGGDLETDIYASGAIGMMDYDRDGIIDLWPSTIGQWQYGPAPTSRMRVFHGNGDGTYQEVGAQLGIPQTKTGDVDYRMVFGVTSCDVDLDGDRDVLLAEYGTTNAANHLYTYDKGKFTDVGEQLGIARGTKGVGGFTFGIACGDLDDDGDVDLMTAALQHAWYPDTDHTEPLINNTPPGQPLLPFVRPGRETLGLDRPHTGTKWTEGDSQVFFVDVDLDGRKDVVIASVNYPQQYGSDPDWTHTWVYRQKEDGKFEDVTAKTPFWDKKLQTLGGMSLVDIDNDGDLDIVTGTSTYNSQYIKITNTIRVFRNDIGQAQNFVTLKMIGQGAGHSNVAGIGARVELYSGGRVQHQEVLGPSSSTQDDLTFGLGSACDIDKVVVHWPDAAGTTTTYEHVLSNYLVEIHEGKSEVTYKKLDGK